MAQARAYNLSVPNPCVPQQLLQDLLQESIRPDVICFRRRLQGCRLATYSSDKYTVAITAAGARGATTKPRAAAGHQRAQWQQQIHNSAVSRACRASFRCV
jgi:hypothetical protein